MVRIKHGRRAIGVAAWLVAACLILTGCSDDDATGTNAGSGMDSGSDADNSGSGSDGLATSPPTVPVTENRAGNVYRQEIQVAETGETIVIQVMEPSQLVEGESYPLVLHGHGYGGQRNVEPSEFQQRLRETGYYVISIDQRGFGESTGTVRVMSPDFEGQSLIAVLDWAEDLEGLRRRANLKMMVGSYGGSYGGMYQYLLAGADPQERLRVIAPDIAPYDLTYSLNPNNVIKSGWALALIGAGELPVLGLAGGDPTVILDDALEQVERAEGLRQDPVIYESVLRGALTNNFPQASANLFRYHSLRYFCEDEPAGSQAGFTIGQPDPRNVPPGGLHEIDALITQGFRDTLFNFNEAVNTYQCLQRQGGDVRLLTHQSGHILPASLGTAGLEDPIDPFYAALTAPGFQDAGGTRSCGSLDLDDVTFAWFETKLRSQEGALESALSIGDNICLSLAENDAIAVEQVPVGGMHETIQMQTPALSGPLGLLGSVLGSEPRERLLQTQPLYAAPMDGAIIAGIPQMDIKIQPLVGEARDCTLEILPLGCDPIYFFALGQRPPGQQRWDIIDDQLTPVRGFGTHELDMTGIAERLDAGDEIALLIYGFHPQYPISFSRDLLVPAASISGLIALPIINPADGVEEDV